MSQLAAAAVERPYVIGILAGSVVAPWLYYGIGESVLAVAIWHASYNMAEASLRGREPSPRRPAR